MGKTFLRKRRVFLRKRRVSSISVSTKGTPRPQSLSLENSGTLSVSSQGGEMRPCEPEVPHVTSTVKQCRGSMGEGWGQCCVVKGNGFYFPRCSFKTETSDPWTKSCPPSQGLMTEIARHWSDRKVVAQTETSQAWGSENTVSLGLESTTQHQISPAVPQKTLDHAPKLPEWFRFSGARAAAQVLRESKDYCFNKHGRYCYQTSAW